APLDLVTDADAEPAVGVAHLGDVDHALGLGAEVDEDGVVPDRDHPPAHGLADLRLLAPRRRLPVVLGEERREALRVVRHALRRAAARPRGRWVGGPMVRARGPVSAVRPLLHAGAIAGPVAWSFWHIDKVPAKAVPVSSAAELRPPPPPPPAAPPAPVVA